METERPIERKQNSNMKETLLNQTGKIVKDVAIIGGGPAALTAAIYASRGGLDTVLITGHDGGQLSTTTKVENFPGFPDGIDGPELIQRMKQQAQNFGSEIIEENATNIHLDEERNKIKTEGNKEIIAKSVILATGSNPKRTGIGGEDKFWGRGVSSCATCDAPFYKGKSVAIIGGGDSAFTEALHLADFAEHVSILNRGDEPRASQHLKDQVASNSRIQTYNNTVVTNINGEQKVESISTNSHDADGKIIVDGVFVAIGHNPNSELFVNQIQTDDLGYAGKMGEVKTKIPGVFVAGDVGDPDYRQAITAAGQGAVAGMEAVRYVKDKN
jgi:thioredoxin reductase (NADPH)